MKYETPEFTSLGSPINFVQGVISKGGHMTERSFGSNEPVSSYEDWEK
jgi:hypothetical protein